MTSSGCFAQTWLLVIGTPTHGYYVWTTDVDAENWEVTAFVAEQGDNAYQCDVIRVAVVIKSRKHRTERRLEYSQPFEFVVVVSITIFYAGYLLELGATRPTHKNRRCLLGTYILATFWLRLPSAFGR